MISCIVWGWETQSIITFGEDFANNNLHLVEFLIETFHKYMAQILILRHWKILWPESKIGHYWCLRIPRPFSCKSDPKYKNWKVSFFYRISQAQSIDTIKWSYAFLRIFDHYRDLIWIFQYLIKIKFRCE